MQTQLKRWILGLSLFCLCLIKTELYATSVTLLVNNTTDNVSTTGSLRQRLFNARTRNEDTVNITFATNITNITLSKVIDVFRETGKALIISGNGRVTLRGSGNKANMGFRLESTGSVNVYGLQFENFSHAIYSTTTGISNIGADNATQANTFIRNDVAIFSTTHLRIIGNFIGTNRNLSASLGNNSNILGVSQMYITDNYICSAIEDHAIQILSSANSITYIQRNIIGGTSSLGNFKGISILGGDAYIDDNTIYYNGEGITVTGEAELRNNRFACNTTKIYEARAGYTPPTITSAVFNHDGTVRIAGRTNAASDAIEIYESSASCTTLPCQGQRLARFEPNSLTWSRTVSITRGAKILANTSVRSSLDDVDRAQVGRTSEFTTCTIPTCPAMTVTFTKVNDVNCNGGNDGRATVSINVPPTAGGRFRYYVAETELNNPTYAPITNSVTVQNLQKRTYTAFVENTLTGCKYKSAPLSIDQPSAALSLTNCREVAPTSTANSTDGIGEVTVGGGTQSYSLTYQRTGGTPTTISVATASVQRLTGLAAGTYTVVVTDKNHAAGNPKTGCTDTCTFTITPPTCSDLSLAVQQVTNVRCFGNSTGSIQVQYNDLPANLPLTLSLRQGQITLRTIQITTLTAPRTHTFSNLPAGTYTISLSRGNVCTVTRTATISQPSTPLSIKCQNIVNAARVGEASGSADVAISGGVGPYQLNVAGGVTRTYTVSSTAAPFPIPNLSKGNYDVLVTDANNCTQTCNFTINDPDCTDFDVVATAAPVSCFGDNNGQVQLRTANGQAPFTYTWSLANIGNRDFANNLAADTYRITVTDDRLCRDTVGTRVNTPPQLRAVVTPTNIQTSGGNNGSIKILVSGGTREYDAELILNTISRPPTRRVLDTFFFENLTKGTYTYRVWDANDCDTSGTVILTDPNCNINFEAKAIPITCKNANNGKIRTIRTNGTPPFSYTWSIAGLTADSATNLQAGNYWVAIRDGLNCTDTAFATIIEPDSLYTLPQISDVTRVNGNNGSIRITIIGGTAPFTVRLQNGILATQLSNNTFTFNGLTRGTYTYTVIDTSGCRDIKTVIINDPVCGITIRIQTDLVNCNGGNDGRIRLTLGNANAPLSIRWSNGIPNDLQTVENLRAGTYSFSITDNSGCTKDSMATVNQPTRLTSTFDTTKVTRVGFSDGTITVQVSGGTPTYTVKIGNDTTATALNATTFRFNNLGVGTYTYVVSDTNGCTTNQQVIIEGPICNLNLTKQVVNVSCNGNNNGRITFTPSGISYTWLPNVSTNNVANNLSIGIYRVTATDGFGCQKTDSALITQPTVLSSNANPRAVTILSPPNGSVAIGVSGGTAPHRVILNSDSLLIAAGDSARFANLAAGNYTYTVRDNNGCTTTGTFTVNSLNCNVTITSQVTNVLCNGGSTGRIILTVTGRTGMPNTVWSDASIGNTLTANNLRAGTYSATVTYPDGCSATATATVNTPSVLTSNSRTSPITQTSPPNGRVAIGVSGGTAPYRVILNNDSLLIVAGDSARFSNLAAGNYTYIVRDNNGCTSTGTFTINSLSCNVTITPQVTNVLCNGAATGRIILTVTGRTGMPNTVWSDASIGNTLTANNLRAGTYSATVTYPDGCSATATATVNTPSVLTSNSRTSPITQTSPPNGSVAIGVSGGTAPYRVILNSDSLIIAAGDSARFSNLTAGNYTYIVRDNNGCTSTGTFTINPINCNLSAPTRLDISRDSVCNGTSVTLTTPSLNQAILYRWQTPVGVTTTSAPNLTLSNLTNSNSGLYTLILSFNGCESPPSPSVRLTVVDISTQRVFAGLDKTECGNTTTALTASPLINANFTGNWQSLNAAVIAQINQSSTAASGLKSGNNQFVWSVSSSVCGLVGRDTMIVYVEKMPVLTETTLSLDSKSSSLLVNMREVLRDSFNFKITITLPSQGFAQIQNGRFLFFDRANLTAAQRIDIPYRLCGLQCPNLCADSKLIIDVAASELDSQELEVQKLLSSNSSVSPFLEIKGIELLDEVECIIVDRWGTRVFGPVSYQNNTAGRAWDGTKNGKQLPNGAYYYSLKYIAKATKRIQRGIIYLLDGL